jgi:hypothetical protein
MIISRNLLDIAARDFSLVRSSILNMGFVN